MCNWPTFSWLIHQVTDENATDFLSFRQKPCCPIKWSLLKKVPRPERWTKCTTRIFRSHQQRLGCLNEYVTRFYWLLYIMTYIYINKLLRHHLKSLLGLCFSIQFSGICGFITQVCSDVFIQPHNGLPSFGSLWVGRAVPLNTVTDYFQINEDIHGYRRSGSVSSGFYPPYTGNISRKQI